MRTRKTVIVVLAALLIGSFGFAGSTGNRSGIRPEPCPDRTVMNSSEYRQAPLPYYCTVAESSDPVPQGDNDGLAVVVFDWLITVSTLGIPFGT